MFSSARKLWSLFSRRDRVNAAILFALMAVGAVLEVVGVGAIPAFIALLNSPERVMANPRVQQVYDTLGLTSVNQLFMVAAAALVAIFLLKNVYLAWMYYAKPRFVYNRYIAVATRLFETYLRAPYTFHLSRNTAELLRNTNSETHFIVQQFMMPGLVVTMESLVVLALAALLLVREPVVSLFAVVGLGAASLLFYRLIRGRMGRLGLVAQRHRRLMIQTVNEGLGGVKDVKVLGREQHFLQRFAESAREYASAARFRNFVAHVPGPFFEVIAIVGMILIAAALLAQGRPVETIVPTLALFAVATVRLLPSLRRIMQSVAALRFYTHSVDAVYGEITTLGLNGRRRSPAQDGRVSPSELAFDRSLRLEDVSFRYEDSHRLALENVSLTIERGRAVGFVGPSGAGKSTLVGIILGLFAPSSGILRVDELDLHAEGLIPLWQRKIGYIPQSIFLADTSIQRNVAFGLSDEEIDDDAVWDAIRAAQLSDLVQDVPQGLGTVIGERGVRLSGGQVQRIGIARALYHRPKVLIMDEATSSVDHDTELRIVQTINELRDHHTLITIAHRLTTVKACDWIYRIDQGRIVSEGVPAEVLGKEDLNVQVTHVNHSGLGRL